MSRHGVTDEWVEDHNHTPTPTRRAHTHTRLNLDARANVLSVKADLITATPISERSGCSAAGGRGRLRTRCEMSSQSADTRPVAASIPISGGRQSNALRQPRTDTAATCRAAVSAKRTASGRPVFFGSTEPAPV